MPGAFTAYVDESGDAGLDNIDPSFPVFVLCVALYKTNDDLIKDVNYLSSLKIKFWHNDGVVFHSYKIRNKVCPFENMNNPEVAEAFMGAVGKFFEQSCVTLIAAAINKPKHKAQYREPVHPYDLAVQFCLERVYGHVGYGGEVMFVFEKRGKTENKILRKNFLSVCARGNLWKAQLPFQISFASKSENIPGLQVADLAAYPIARVVETANRGRKDWLSILPRIRKNAFGRIDGWGLKIFPL
jgi:hypothetical protein